MSDQDKIAEIKARLESHYIKKNVGHSEVVDDIRFLLDRLEVLDGCLDAAHDRIKEEEEVNTRLKTTAFQAQNMATEISEQCKKLEAVRAAADKCLTWCPCDNCAEVREALAACEEKK